MGNFLRHRLIVSKFYITILSKSRESYYFYLVSLILMVPFTVSLNADENSPRPTTTVPNDRD